MKRSMNALRLGVAGVLCVAILGMGCGDDDDTDAAAPSTTASTSAASSALEGRWQTEPISLADMETALRDAGLEKQVAQFEQNAPISDAPTALILDVGDAGTSMARRRESP